ncbi:hypothetical protein GCM10023322_13500 [Rugosimonospora acidiphila]|uniref:Uncharacterized protein n=1 Tax=Rugosimonospora acidiphila TaxID=556531 RepID=A0ABP9RLU2_9ACTN
MIENITRTPSGAGHARLGVARSAAARGVAPPGLATAPAGAGYNG